MRSMASNHKLSFAKENRDRSHVLTRQSLMSMQIEWPLVPLLPYSNIKSDFISSMKP